MYAEPVAPAFPPAPGCAPPGPFRFSGDTAGSCPTGDLPNALLDYLGRRLRSSGLSYAVAPAPLADGWETYLYSFQLQGTALPEPWERPLVLRIHAGAHGRPRARHEFQVSRHLLRLGFPAPAPVLLEEECHPFGGPFLISEKVPGETLLQAALRKPWHPLLFPDQLGETQARLHGLPPEGFPAPPGPFLQRHLDAMRAAVGAHHLEGLAAGLDWLHAHRPGEVSQPSILHLDYHPLNLIERQDGSVAVLDWTYADLGDPHADVATTLMILQTVPTLARNVWERVALPVGRPLTWGWYLHAYRRSRPLDRDRLAYFRAWAAFRQLVRYGVVLRGGAAANGCKASLAQHLGPELLGALRRYFRRWAGTDVSL